MATRRMARLPSLWHGFNDTRLVHYELFADAQQYDTWVASVSAPTLVFQGRSDDTVDPDSVRRFADGHSNITLHLVDDDHQLLASLPLIWQLTAAFLGLEAA